MSHLPSWPGRNLSGTREWPGPGRLLEGRRGSPPSAGERPAPEQGRAAGAPPTGRGRMQEGEAGGGEEEGLQEQTPPPPLGSPEPTWASAPTMAPHNWLDTEEVQSCNKPAQRGQVGAPQASFWTTLTKWAGRARRARGPGRRWGHTTSYCSTWGRGAREVTAAGGRGSADMQGTHPPALGGPFPGPARTLQGPDSEIWH